MFFTPIWNFIASIANWFWFKATLKLKVVIIVVITGVVIIAGVSAYIIYQTHRINSLREENRQQQLNHDLEAVGAATNQVETLQKEANQATNNSNAALGEFSNSLNKDSSKSSSNQKVTDDRFCAKFPKDSSCVGRGR